MSIRKSKVVKVNISAGTYKDEAEAVKEANAIKRWLIRYCDKNGYSIKGKVWISTNSAYAGRIINKGRKKEYKPNGKPLPTVVEAHIHMVLFCNPASTIVDALKSYLNKKHMKAVVWDRHCNSRAEVENAVEYAMRQSRKVRTIDYDRKDVLSVDEWGYYEAVEKAEARIKDNMTFTKFEPEQMPETLENKSVSSISDTPETLTYKSIKYNYLYYYIVSTSYNHSIIKALLQTIIYYSRDCSRSSCSKIIFKIVLLKVPHLLKNVKLCVIITMYDESEYKESGLCNEVNFLGYSKCDILRKCQTVFNDIKTFYKQSFINYNGKTTDTNEYYTEVVADFLCDNITEFMQGIPQITREVSYKTLSHNGIFDNNTPREEEKIAMEMFCQSQNGVRYDYIGDIIDYQTPLKNIRSDVAGKIDLLSYDGRTLYILELKKPDSDESMLRCVLEGFTYMQTVNKVKLLEDFNLPANTIIKASPFVFRGMLQHQQMKEERPSLFKLMQLLDSTPYYIYKENSKYKVEE